MKKITTSAIVVAAAALALSGCGAAPGGTSTGDTSKAATQYPDFTACMVSDAGGFDDRSFNQSGWEGMAKAQSELGVKVKQVESKDSTDYDKNLDAMKANNCGITFTVGFNLEQATKSHATTNTDLKYAIIDDNGIQLPNVKSLIFKTSDAAFLAGYVAAGYSKTGTVATFGGGQIPTVTIFMDGFVDGVAKYNEDFSKSVKVLGWDKATQNGSFTGDFDNQSNGQNMTTNFISQGADVIMPVAGPVGLGAAAAAKAAGDVALVWVDADGYETASNFKDLFLTSVVKEIGVSVFDTIKDTASGNYSNKAFVGTLANGGVGIAPYHDFDSKLSAELKAKVEDLKQQITDGSLKVTSPSDPK
ncbi:MAG: BMP family ABC transporter substrate-binding protein [Propionibacteriaceae bacterium]|nr:BMP family ABC transporter substrate-binding protein [Propionibacteriaceae bacterium]